MARVIYAFSGCVCHAPFLKHSAIFWKDPERDDVATYEATEKVVGMCLLEVRYVQLYYHVLPFPDYSKIPKHISSRKPCVKNPQLKEGTILISYTPVYVFIMARAGQ